MGLKNKIYRVHAALLIASIVPLTILSFSGPLNADSLQVVENDIISPASLPQKQTMRQIAFLTLTIEGRIVGGMAVYDELLRKGVVIMRRSTTPRAIFWLLFGLTDLGF
jgi:hypothetical protein